MERPPCRRECSAGSGACSDGGSVRCGGVRRRRADVRRGRPVLSRGGVWAWFAGFRDVFVTREPKARQDTSVATLIGQRVFEHALGYEDLNGHDELRHDPLMAVLAGKRRPGEDPIRHHVRRPGSSKR